MNTRRHQRLTNANRVLIFALTSGGMLMDGAQFADVLCIVALFVWLWLPLCTRLEAHLLCWLDEKRTSSGGIDDSDSVPRLPFTNLQTRNQA